MKITTITNPHFQKPFLLFCSALLITTIYLKESSVAAENTSLTEQDSNKTTIKKDDQLPHTPPSSNVVVEVNGIKLTQGSSMQKPGACWNR